ncbi:HAMP domain-containing sensor histidine kinase [Anaerosporobacter faecicola]|uniref:HAMP domain-containing sensor histidine kinase n=1 Tax=Anaerosporobacter faecicola TaxID=2718714 RepID=UPI00143AAD8A|nr:HAMP domain-containing sensor histidine kinase [Anaerosporobacter faecicola]
MTKKWIIGLHIVVLLLILCGIRYINHCDYNKADIASLNKSYMRITEELQENPDADITALEERYHCNLSLVQDADYQQVMYEAIKNGYVVFDYRQENQIIGKIIFEGGSATYSKLKELLIKALLIMSLVILLIYDVSLGFVSYYYIRPFYKLRAFASEVAKGNLDIPLGMNKHNYFGVFTESFDLMRVELKKAKQKEYEANQSKKELVASLSHDMKTPIATIQACCEVLDIKLAGNENLDKVQLIEDRANMINNLLNNMFHATLEELEELEVNVQDELSTVLKEIVEKAQTLGGVLIQNTCPECMLRMDALRLAQVVDNIISNAKKYGKTKVEISYEDAKNGVILKIRDHGQGVPEEALPLLIEKFYRAENAKGCTGAGLGMYLADYFMKRMEGDLVYYNEEGFVVEIFVRKA